MDIQYQVTQTRGCYIIMPFFTAEASDTFPARRITDMNDFYASVTESIRQYAAQLAKDFPHSRYTCLGEVFLSENGDFTVELRLHRRSPGQKSVSRLIRHIWRQGLLLRQITEG